MPQYTIQEVAVENVTKGRNSYFVANVVYNKDGGENKTKKVMSFANPSVFNAVKDAKQGDVFDIEFTPGDQYYNWAKATPAGSAKAPAADSKGASVTSSRSTYETPEERAKKQVYIIKQSCLAQAVAAKGPDQDVQDYLETAQSFVDWVMDDGTMGSMETVD